MDDKDIRTCSQCGKQFEVRNEGDMFPGGKEKEEIYCPYCHTYNGSIMTSGRAATYAIKSIKSQAVKVNCMGDEGDDIEDVDLSVFWVPVDDSGDYSPECNQHRDIVCKVENILYQMALAHLSKNQSGEFGLSDLVGQGNANAWNTQPLSDLKMVCKGDEDAKLNAGMALKKSLYKHGGFEMSKRGNGVNMYRKVAGV